MICTPSFLPQEQKTAIPLGHTVAVCPFCYT